MPLRVFLSVVLFSAVLGAGIPQAHAGEMHGTVKAGDITVDRAWSRATPKGAKVGAGYITIRNTGTADDRLIAAKASFAGKVQVHTMSMDNGVMKMRRLKDGLVIPAGGHVMLKPGADHVMFMDLKAPIEKGKSFKATLVFEKAGEVTVMFKTVGIGAASSHDGHGSHAGHSQ